MIFKSKPQGSPFQYINWDDILSFALSLIDATAPEGSTLHLSPLRHRGPPQRAAGVGLTVAHIASPLSRSEAISSDLATAFPVTSGLFPVHAPSQEPLRASSLPAQDNKQESVRPIFFLDTLRHPSSISAGVGWPTFGNPEMLSPRVVPGPTHASSQACEWAGGVGSPACTQLRTERAFSFPSWHPTLVEEIPSPPMQHSLRDPQPTAPSPSPQASPLGSRGGLGWEVADLGGLCCCLPVSPGTQGSWPCFLEPWCRVRAPWIPCPRLWAAGKKHPSTACFSNLGAQGALLRFSNFPGLLLEICSFGKENPGCVVSFFTHQCTIYGVLSSCTVETCMQSLPPVTHLSVSWESW